MVGSANYGNWMNNGMSNISGSSYGLSCGGNPYTNMIRPSMMPSFGGYYNAPYIQPQQSGGLLGRVGYIKIDGAGLDINKLVEMAGTVGDKGKPTPAALQAQKILGTDKLSGAAALRGQKVANFCNVANTIVGAGSAIIGTWMNMRAQNRISDLQEKYMDKMEGLAEKYMNLQERGMEIHQEIMEGKQRTVVELAEIQAEIEKFKIRKESETSIQNTKTAASYGYMDNKFYGNPVKAL